MKATSKIICGLVLVFALVLTICIAQESPNTGGSDKFYSAEDLKTMLEALAQVEPVPFAKVPPQKFSTFGYWSFQNPAGPPLPGNPLQLDIWSLGDGFFVMDDRKVDYAALEAEAAKLAALEAEATGNSHSPKMRMSSSLLNSYGNLVYLSNLVVTNNGSTTVAFDIGGGTNLVPYDILTTTNLANPISTWNWLGIGYTSNRYTFISQPSNSAFYILAKPSKTMAVGIGSDSLGQCDVPYGLTNVLQGAAGPYQSLALKKDGTVVAWGANYHGEGVVPTNLVGVAMISAGWYFNVALLTNGTLTAWGQMPVPMPGNLTNGTANITVISTQVRHTLALTSTGNVVAWGDSSSYGEDTAPSGLTNVTAIAAGGRHNLVVANGTVVAWGYNGFGETNVPVGLSNVVDVAAGYYHSLALLKNGTVVAWGDTLTAKPMCLPDSPM